MVGAELACAGHERADVLGQTAAAEAEAGVQEATANPRVVAKRVGQQSDIGVDGLAKEISRIYEQQTVDSDNPLTIFGDDIREIAPGTRREQYLAMRRGVGELPAESGVQIPCPG